MPSNLWIIFCSWIALAYFMALVPVSGQQTGPFFEILPALNITPNSFPLNSTKIEVGAMLILSSKLDQNRLMIRGFADVANLECQRAIINSSPELLPDIEIDLVYFDVSFFNTSRATVTALEYSLDPTHIATLGPDSADLLLPMAEYLESLQISNYNARYLSSTFSSPTSFFNVRTVTQSDAYMIKSYAQLITFFGWSWIGAAFADDDVGQAGRYGFGGLSDDNLFFPCYIIVGFVDDAGLSTLASCLKQFPEVKVLLLWGSAQTSYNTIRYLYEKTDITGLTFVLNTQAAKEFPKILGRVPASYYKGLLFLDINYDPKPYEKCMETVFTDASVVPDWAITLAEKEYNCIFDTTGTSTLPECTSDSPSKNHNCRCSLAMLDSEKQPYSSLPTMYRDILTGYAIALHTIKYNCSALKGDYCNLDSVTGIQLIAAMSQIPYVGYTGYITFDQMNSTNRINGTLDVYQLVPVEESQVHLTAPGTILLGYMIPASLESYSGIYLDQNQFRFITGGNSVPISVAVPETTDLSSGFWPCFIFALCIVGLVLVGIAILFTAWKWFTPIVRKAGRIFLSLILIGTACAFTADLLWSVQASRFICVIKSILSFISVTTICGALFAKSVEFYQIFSNVRQRRYEESGSSRAYTFLICMAVVWANSILWYFLYTFVNGAILCQPFQSSVDYFYWYVSCAPSNPTASDVYIILWISLTTAVNFYALIMVAIAWDITSVYSLARCIVFVEANLIVLAVTIMPLYYSLPVYPNYATQQYLIRSLSTIFAAAFTLLFVFVPLIYSYYKPRDDEDDFIEDHPMDGDRRTGFSRIPSISALSHVAMRNSAMTTDGNANHADNRASNGGNQ